MLGGGGRMGRGWPDGEGVTGGFGACRRKSSSVGSTTSNDNDTHNVYIIMHASLYAIRACRQTGTTIESCSAIPALNRVCRTRAV